GFSTTTTAPSLSPPCPTKITTITNPITVVDHRLALDTTLLKDPHPVPRADTILTNHLKAVIKVVIRSKEAIIPSLRQTPSTCNKNNPRRAVEEQEEELAWHAWPVLACVAAPKIFVIVCSSLISIPLCISCLLLPGSPDTYKSNTTSCV
ncbi:hypothetical protein RSAG8_11896, partial [Rhizoctonia solani AG-8 WAC10335]